MIAAANADHVELEPIEAAKLIALFDVLESLDNSTHTVLWAYRFASAEAALRLWCGAKNIRLLESKSEHGREHGHSLEAMRPDYTTIVTVRLDDPRVT